MFAEIDRDKDIGGTIADRNYMKTIYIVFQSKKKARFLQEKDHQ